MWRGALASGLVSSASRNGVTFVILCLGRTGSTHLVSLLDSHPRIRCFGELFTHHEGTLDEAYVTSSRSDPQDYVAHLTAPLTESAVGFKLPLSSIRAHPNALDLLEPQGMRVVRLSRQNLLALFVSRRLLASTRVPQSTRGDYGDATVMLDPKQCLSVFRKTEEHERYLDEIAAGKPVFRITYEELVTGQQLAEIQRFLGVEPATLRSPFSRIRSRSLAETIENWPEVENALRGSPYERFLEDDLELA
jgi:sulfotransferase family protein